MVLVAALWYKRASLGGDDTTVAKPHIRPGRVLPRFRQLPAMGEVVYEAFSFGEPKNVKSLSF